MTTTRIANYTRAAYYTNDTMASHDNKPITFGVDRAALITGRTTRFIRHLVAKAAARAAAGLPVPDDEIPHIRWSERIIRFREDDLRAWMRRLERGKGAEPETKEIA